MPELAQPPSDTPREEDLALHIEASQDRYAVGEEIILAATFHNQSDRALIIAGYAVGTAAEGVFLAWLTRYVVHAAGARLKTSGPIVKSGVEPRLLPIPLAPGAAHRVAPVPLSGLEVERDGQWRALNQSPGAYTVQMVYTLDPQAPSMEGTRYWIGEAASNSISLLVT